MGLLTIAVLVWRTTQYSAFVYQGGIVLLSLATVLVAHAAEVAVHQGHFGEAQAWLNRATALADTRPGTAERWRTRPIAADPNDA